MTRPDLRFGQVPAPDRTGSSGPHLAALSADDWLIIREIRLRALADAPYAFTSTYERERGFDEATWRSWATTCQWFVAFDDDEPVAVAGAIPVGSGGARPARAGGNVGGAHPPRETNRRWSPAGGGRVGSVQGASSLRLGVLEGNDDARAAYVKLGLRLSGDTEVTAGDPVRTIEFLELDLADTAG